MGSKGTEREHRMPESVPLRLSGKGYGSVVRQRGPAEDPGLQEAGGVHPSARVRLQAHAKAHQAPVRQWWAPAGHGKGHDGSGKGG